MLSLKNKEQLYHTVWLFLFENLLNKLDSANYCLAKLGWGEYNKVLYSLLVVYLRELTMLDLFLMHGLPLVSGNTLLQIFASSLVC